MGLAAALVAMAVSAGAATPASAAPPLSDGPPTAAQYQLEIDDLGVLATLQGKEVRAADVIPPSAPIPTMFGPPGSDRARQGLLEYAMAGVRSKAINALVAALIPDCPTAPTAADIAAFYPFWRAGYARLHGTITKDGVSRPYPSPADLSAIGPELPSAQTEVTRFIHAWRIYHCVQQKYGGQAFRKFSLGDTGFDPYWRPTDKLWIEAPDANYLIPVGSLLDLISAGRNAGLLSFPSDAYRQAFARNYNSTQSNTCFNDVDAAVAYFTTPPWQGGSFPPVAKAQTAFRTWSAKSAGFEVAAPGWDGCIGPGNILIFQHAKPKGFAEFGVFPGGMSDVQAVLPSIFQSMFSSQELAERGVTVPPLRKLGRASIAGIDGDLFGADAAFGGNHISIEITLVSLDPDHVGFQMVAKSNPPSPPEARDLDQLLSSVRIVTPTPH